MAQSRKKLAACVTAALIAAVGTTAWSQTNVDQQYKDYHDSRLQAELAATNEACGSQIAAGFDWPTYRERVMGPTNAYAYCASTFTALRHLCAEPSGQETVRQHVSRIVCAFGESGTRDVSLKDGTLAFTIDWVSPGNVEFIEAYLRGVL